MTELTKPVTRKVHIPDKGDFVVTMTKDGVSIRKLGRRKAVTLPYEQLALRALERQGWMLSAKEWSDPLSYAEQAEPIAYQEAGLTLWLGP